MKKTCPSPEALLVAIRAKCMDCSGGQRILVERCSITQCPLHPYRSIKAMGEFERGNREIEGQIDLYDILTLTEGKAI